MTDGSPHDRVTAAVDKAVEEEWGASDAHHSSSSSSSDDDDDAGAPLGRVALFGAETAADSTSPSFPVPDHRTPFTEEEQAARCRALGLKPLPEYRVEEIRQTTRDVLRVLAMLYDVPRGRTRVELELSIVKRLAEYHPNNPEYDVSNYEATERVRPSAATPAAPRSLVGDRLEPRGRGLRTGADGFASSEIHWFGEAGRVPLLPATGYGISQWADTAAAREALAATATAAAEPDSLRGGLFHFAEEEGDVMLGMTPQVRAAYRWCARCGTHVSTRFHNWYLHILKCDPYYYQNELAAFYGNKMAGAAPVLPPYGYAAGKYTSVEQEQHALASRAKYTAALHGLGPERVRVVSNAWRYWESEQQRQPETLQAQVEALARLYRHRQWVRMLMEADEAPFRTALREISTAGEDGARPDRLRSRAADGDGGARPASPKRPHIEASEGRREAREKKYMSALHQLGLARSTEEIAQVQREFETAFATRFAPRPPAVRRVDHPPPLPPTLEQQTLLSLQPRE
ncbi:hypothetical protein CDCA_CDCA03G0818 [Cyanidium caldarium]|uniref:Uncharacterized protein n=1 Tax=Cyanidium caldarium TaxID=2771 RepID=A0AAV9IRA6_CYACA|nr:hypothetical protein CDCA_CDCA03G0818 [Cyanidium caldarium]